MTFLEDATVIEEDLQWCRKVSTNKTKSWIVWVSQRGFLHDFSSVCVAPDQIFNKQPVGVFDNVFVIASVSVKDHRARGKMCGS